MNLFNTISIYISLNFNVLLAFESNLFSNETLQRYVRQTKTQRKIVHSKDELNLTEVVEIDNNPCKTQNLVSVFIHSAGHSTGKYFDKRQSQRQTWVSDLKNLNISVYFVIALNKNQTINEELREESNKYGDILQFGFIDAYHNLTLKAISILRWINKNCLKSTHILKTDDDVVVNPHLLLDKLSEFKTGISGVIAREPTQRNTTSIQ